MPERAVYVLVVEGFAHWEPAHALAELRRHGGYRVETVGLSGRPVGSMGGMRVLPTTTVSDVDPADVAVFILPGGDRWERVPVEVELARLLAALDGRQAPIAAICGATVAIARTGLLRGRRHTSNGLAYLRSHVPGYSEDANYVDAPAVRDRGPITASGLADVEFARELFEELHVLSGEARAAWAETFRSARLPEAPELDHRAEPTTGSPLEAGAASEPPSGRGYPTEVADSEGLAVMEIALQEQEVTGRRAGGPAAFPAHRSARRTKWTLGFTTAPAQRPRIRTMPAETWPRCRTGPQRDVSCADRTR